MGSLSERKSLQEKKKFTEAERSLSQQRHLVHWYRGIPITPLSGGNLYYKGPALQKIIPVFGGGFPSYFIYYMKKVKENFIEKSINKRKYINNIEKKIRVSVDPCSSKPCCSRVHCIDMYSFSWHLLKTSFGPATELGLSTWRWGWRGSGPQGFVVCRGELRTCRRVGTQCSANRCLHPE